MNLSYCDEDINLIDSMSYLNIPVSNKPGISNQVINTQDYSIAVKRIRRFLEEKGWYEVQNHSGLSILAASMDPCTNITYNYAGEVWPLPQTGQMWLEHELLTNPDVPGVFCLRPGYRTEDTPSIEFIGRGSMEELIELKTELLIRLGFGEKDQFVRNDYRLGEEDRLRIDNGSHVLFENLSNTRMPFWNMRQSTGADTGNMEIVILHGMEAIRSAELATSKREMLEQFYNIKEGNHANILFSNFTKDRVCKELDKYLRLDMVDRCGGTIGLTEIIIAMKRSNILYKEDTPVEMLEIVNPAIEESKIAPKLKRGKSRCWGLPVAVKKHSSSIGSLLAVAATSGGEKVVELAINSI